MWVTCGVCSEIVEQFKGRQRGTVPTSFYDMVGDKQAGSDITISQYGVDLSFMAQQGLLPPVIGREEEIDRIAQVTNISIGRQGIEKGSR